MNVLTALPDQDILHVADIAPILGVHPQSIRTQAQKDIKQLGFPVSVIGNKVLIPKAGFLNWYYNVQLHHINNSN